MSYIAKTVIKEEKRLWCLYALIVSGAVFVVSLLAVMLTAWTEAEQQSDHAYSVLGASNRLLHGLESAALSQRNYLITHDPAYLHSCAESIVDVDKGYALLLPAVGDDDGSKDMLGRLATFKQRVVDELQTTIALLDEGHSNDMLLAFRAAEENLSMFDFKTDMNELLTYWRARRASADEGSHQLLRGNIVIMVVASFLLIATLIGTAFWQRRSFREIASASDRLDAEATEDALTGLANRRQLLRALDMFSCATQVSSAAMLYMDIDGFKAINDVLGHTAGDELLKEIAAILKKCVRSSDVLARVGGDEFVIFLPAHTDEEFLKAVAKRLIAEVALLAKTSYGGRFSLGLSVGISSWPGQASSPDNLIRSADAAMYFAKRNGKNRYQMAERPTYLNLDLGKIATI